MFVFLIEVECVLSDVGANSYTCNFVEQHQAFINAAWICQALARSRQTLERTLNSKLSYQLGFVTSIALVDIFLNVLAVNGCITSYPSSLTSQHVLYMSDITSMYKKFLHCHRSAQSNTVLKHTST